MQTEKQNLSPEELLEQQVEKAFLGKDEASLRRFLTGKDVSAALKEAALEIALETGRLEAVRFVMEDVKPVMTDIHCICLVLDACKRQQPEIALYLCEKSAALGLERRDAFALIFERFAPALHAVAADQLLDYALDKQDALDKMLLAAADTKAFDILPYLLDRGANPDTGGGVVLSLLTTAYPPEYFAEKEKYLGLLEKLLGNFSDRAALDNALPVAAYKIAGQAQYPAVAEMLLAHGADPWGNREEAKHVLVGGTVAPAGEQKWESLFAAAQDREVATCRREFSALFGDSFLLRDLRQTVNEDGDTGLMLAAKGRVLDRVVEAAVKESAGGGRNLFADLAEMNLHSQSVLSLAIDRGDAAVLFNPACWSKDDLRAVEGYLSPEQAAHIDMAALFARFDRHALKEKAAKFKLQPGPRRGPPPAGAAP